LPATKPITELTTNLTTAFTTRVPTREIKEGFGADPGTDCVLRRGVARCAETVARRGDTVCGDDTGTGTVRGAGLFVRFDFALSLGCLLETGELAEGDSVVKVARGAACFGGGVFFGLISGFATSDFGAVCLSGVPRELPHSSQYLKSRGFLWSQDGQEMMSSRSPHSSQNFMSGKLACEHFGQVIRVSRSPQFSQNLKSMGFWVPHAAHSNILASSFLTCQVNFIKLAASRYWPLIKIISIQ
jgi:hypothetical protein